MEEETQKTGMSKNMIMVGIAVVVIIAVIAAGGFVLTRNKQQAVVEVPKQDSATGAMQENGNSQNGTTAYKDGKYEAVGEYSYHSGKESIDVTVTLTNGVIEEVDVKALAKSSISKEKQADFIANYKEQVVGKNIDEVNLGKISGSSLTPLGFNAALDDIKSQAKVSS